MDVGAVELLHRDWKSAVKKAERLSRWIDMNPWLVVQRIESLRVKALPTFWQILRLPG
jgi:hypothetical protein